jgi:large subunit ribosomal protein L33
LVLAGSPRSPSDLRPDENEEEGTMPKNDKRVKITLECTECKRRNYITMKSKINDRERLEMQKYCSHDRKHTLHKETR